MVNARDRTGSTSDKGGMPPALPNQLKPWRTLIPTKTAASLVEMPSRIKRQNTR